jgi:hypothetical protein
MLADVGITSNDFALFDKWDGQLSDEQARVASKLLYRLTRMEGVRAPLQAGAGQQREGLDESLEAGRPGTVAIVDGVATSSSAVPLPETASAALDRSELSLTVVQRRSGDRVAVLSKDIPAAWKLRRAGRLEEPTEVAGVVLGSMELEGGIAPLILAYRLKWRPTAGVNAGVVWLARNGFDASLFDDVRHGQAFAKPSESLEDEAFYACLSLMADSKAAAELAQVVRDALPARANDAADEAAETDREIRDLSAKLRDADVGNRKDLEERLRIAQSRHSIAAGVASQAERGLSSVVHLFLEPKEHTGDAVLIEGTARRAVRIVVDHAAASSALVLSGGEHGIAARPVGEYYELDVFTKDSQHLPIICCVPALPEGFPTGEVIREPVRLAGVFFKKWAFARRMTDAPATQARRLPERLPAPLIIAATPERLASPQSTVSSYRGLLGGFGFVATMLLIWLFVARASRGDRMAQASRARYDLGFEEFAKP